MRIKVLDRDYEWSSLTRKPAPWPKDNIKAVNVRLIEHAERPKDCFVEISNDKMSGNVEWLMEDSRCLSDAFKSEIIRAFKANGAKPGCQINVKYGIRDDGLTDSLVLEIE